ncbi:hypothetical protein, conserved [Eimeria praecox]|uniref:Uncharacterized protein n=1 Tax=Eimeria praecox TaxID=51316 RepID=U6HBH9_9EIME|nr:hypothetical protein, conserved [Eimeria praecox]
MRRRLHANPITTFLDAAEEPEQDMPELPTAEMGRRGAAAATAEPTMQHATAEAVNLLLEDIDALATENALLTVLRNTVKVELHTKAERSTGFTREGPKLSQPETTERAELRIIGIG